MLTRTREEKQAFIARLKKEVETYSRFVDALLESHRRNRGSPPGLAAKLEALRNKRDTAVTKVLSLIHHQDRDWRSARFDANRALRELREAWRTVVGTLQREQLYPR